MKLVIDIQGAQGGNRNRGIGRLTRALARAMVMAPGAHEPVILLNEAIGESAEALGEEFAALLPRRNICYWRGLTDTGGIGGAEAKARREISERIRAYAIAALNADAIHVASVFEGGADDTIVNWPTDLYRPPHVATFYDAIPYINREQYLRGPWQHLARWYLRQVQEVRRYDGLLAISESSGREAIDYLGFKQNCVVNIRAGFDARVFRPVPLAGLSRANFFERLGLRADYILFVGAGDPRKNEMGLLLAYSKMPEGLRMRHQLVIVGAGDPDGLRERAEALGLRSENLHLPAHIAEPDLAALYSNCSLFVMPSKHEGFGLPALEAMACGAPVLASNTTSLPEVVGLPEALFDPNDTSHMAERMQCALEDWSFRQRLITHGLRQAAGFTWEDCARRAWTGLESMQARGDWDRCAPRTGVPRKKPSLALFGDFPAADPEVARADVDFVSVLGQRYDVTLFTRAPFLNDDELGAAFPHHRYDEFPARATGFDRILYRTEACDLPMLAKLLPIFPGVVIWRVDDNISDLAVLRNGAGHDGLAHAVLAMGGWPALAALHRGERYRSFCKAGLSREAQAMIDVRPSDWVMAAVFAERCYTVVERAYTNGVNAQRQACIRALAAYDQSGLAHALVHTFPSTGGERLFFDESCIAVRSSSVALHDGIRRAILEGKALAEVVSRVSGGLKCLRGRTAAFLGLPDAGLLDETVIPTPSDTLVFCAAETEGDTQLLEALRKYALRGTRLILLMLEDLQHLPAELAFVEGVLCADMEIARSLLMRMTEGTIARPTPLGIGWAADGVWIPPFPAPGSWTFQWTPPTV